MLNVLGRRAPWVQPILYPVQVQGAGAERGIAAALQRWSAWEESGLPEVDVLIVGRGGGSLEDLWNFNEEIVARAIVACEIPVVSAVGHEIDFTIADFVADMRAPTPSAAAELVVPDGEALLGKIHRYSSAMSRMVEGEMKRYEAQLLGMKRGALSMSVDRVLREPLQRILQVAKDLEDAAERQVEQKSYVLERMAQRYATVHPERIIDGRLERVAHAQEKLDHVLERKMAKIEQGLQRQKSLLRALGPESTFERGFSITLDESGALVRSAADVKKGGRLVTKLRDSELISRVEEGE